MISNFGLISLIILDQVHGNDGRVITQNNIRLPFKSESGDYLITNQRNIGLGVLTADCLPIIFVDNATNAVGIAHAGWRGSVKNIALITLERMQQEYGTQIADISIFFGPCAKVCCYEVQPDFRSNFADNNAFFIQRDGRLFFDLPLLNASLLRAIGLPKTAMNEQYNCCTICNDDYFSFRRQGQAAGRNVSVVWIR
jgi:YfiH family protein